MKKPLTTLMMMAWTATAIGIFAAPANQTLLMSVEIAPFKDIASAATSVGKMIDQPMIPALLLGSAQNGLEQTVGGRLRRDAQTIVNLYIDEGTLELKGLTMDDPRIKGKILGAAMYPIAETEAEFLAKFKNAKKDGNGVICFKPRNYVKFLQDGKYCVFSETPETLDRAMADFAKYPTPKANNRKSHLVKLTMREVMVAMAQNSFRQGMETALKDMDRNLQNKSGLEAKWMKLWMKFWFTAVIPNFDGQQNISSMSIALDFDDKGLSLSGGIRRKPGAKVLGAGEALPSGAIDAMPDGATVFTAGNSLSGTNLSAADYEQLKKQFCRLLKDTSAELSKKAAEDAELKKHEKILQDLIAAVGEYAASGEYPKSGDWSSMALGFDAQKRLVVSANTVSENRRNEVAANLKFFDRLLSAVEQKWPNQKCFTKRSGRTYAIDWMALFDAAVDAQKGSPNAQSEAEIAKARKMFQGVVKCYLGGSVSELSFSKNDQRTTFAVTGADVGMKHSGETRFLAAVPEAAKSRPSGVFYFTPYALIRDLLPQIVAAGEIVGPAADPGTLAQLKQIKTMLAVMPPAAPKGAVVGARWNRKDGATLFLLRVTADEVKNIFGAIMAMSGANSAPKAGSGSPLDDDE